MDQADFEWIVGTLLPRHSGYEIKRGPGIDQVVFGINSRYPAKRSSRPAACMYAKRIDGTLTDISWRECLKPASKRFKVRNAMRNAIRPQVKAWRESCEKVCVICGCSLDSDYFDADHYPRSFDLIAAEWIETAGLSEETIETIGTDDFAVGDKFVDVNLESQWFTYHAEKATYRQLCTPCHRKAGR